MKIKYITSLVIAIGLLLSSCIKETKQQDIKPLNENMGKSISINNQLPNLKINSREGDIVKIPENQELVEIDSLIEDYYFVQLETTTESLVGEVENILFEDNFLYVFDKKYNFVLQFDNLGNFVKKIGKKGRGPGEYIKIYDIALNKEKKELSLLDLDGRKILYYDDNGNFKREIPLYYLFYPHRYFEGNMILFTGLLSNSNVKAVDLNRIIVSDQELKPIAKAFPYTQEFRQQNHQLGAKPLLDFSNSIYYSDILSDTIWRISDSDISASYILDFEDPNCGNKKLNINELDDKRIDEIMSKRKQQYFGSFSITDNFLCIGISDQRNVVTPLFWDKNTHNVLYGDIVSSNREQTKLTQIVSLYPKLSYKNDYFVQIVQPYFILSYIESNGKHMPPLTPKEKLFVDKLKADDNPILLFFKLRPID